MRVFSTNPSLITLIFLNPAASKRWLITAISTPVICNVPNLRTTPLNNYWCFFAYIAWSRTTIIHSKIRAFLIELALFKISNTVCICVVGGSIVGRYHTVSFCTFSFLLANMSSYYGGSKASWQKFQKATAKVSGSYGEFFKKPLQKFQETMAKVSGSHNPEACRYVSSPQNQRIELWWSYLVKVDRHDGVICSKS